MPKKDSSAQKVDNESSEGQQSGEGLWGKLRSVRNWKDVNDGNSTLSISQPTQGYKLWDKLLSAAAAYKAAEGDSENESEKEDWEGETHISRILREYYVKKSGDIPNWLYDSKTSSKSTERLAIASLRDNRKRLTERNENMSSRSNFSGSNEKEQSKVYSSFSNLSLQVPAINKGRENSAHDRPSNGNLNYYAQSGGQPSPDKNYDSSKYSSRGLHHSRTLNSHLLSDGITSHQRPEVGARRFDNLGIDHTRGREISTNTKEPSTSVSRARSVSPSPSSRVPPSGIYNRYREAGDVRNKNQEVQTPIGRNYRKGAF
ncbi:36_t:CDS:2 [Acaulospora colombiana]|uniref:36_t:CDS:1 n=1 Tax=Acaulospora colombiana TaxID=27376 RepID=A0ACA9MGR6_9GLOM|nr:36_t:CDS:2 [Acaulospora colombiana]